MRVIVRFSLNKDKGSALRNKLAKILKDAGFVQAAKTGTYDNPNTTAADLSATLTAFWNKIGTHSAKGTKPTLDHFWMYCDG